MVAAEQAGRDDEIHRSLIRSWNAHRFSWPVAYYVGGLMLGIAALVVAPELFTSTRSDHLIGGVIFVILGVGLLGQGGFCLIAPAHQVEEFEGGHFIFHSRYRTIEVSPGDLRSVGSIWIDPNRLLPMCLRSSAGTCFIAPRMSDIEGLYKALSDANPGALVSDPVGILFRGSRQD